MQLATAQPAVIVRDIHTGQKLGVHVRTEAAHYVYQDRKGRFGLARLDRSELRTVAPSVVAA